MDESRLISITEVEYPRLELKFGGKNKDRNPEIIEVAEFIGIKSYKARGKRLSNYEVKVIQELTPEGTEVQKEEVTKPEVKKQVVPKAEIPKAEVPKAEVPKPEKKPPPGKATEAKQDPDEVPLEVVKPKEEKEGPGKDEKKGSGGQFTLEW